MSLESKGKAAANGYVEAINTKDLDSLLALFDENAELIHPFGNFKGMGALAEFYGGVVIHADTILTVSSITAEKYNCVIEVAGVSPQAPDKPQFAMDLFEVNDDGKIVRLAIYYRNFDLG